MNTVEWAMSFNELFHRKTPRINRQHQDPVCVLYNFKKTETKQDPSADNCLPSNFLRKCQIKNHSSFYSVQRM